VRLCKAKSRWGAPCVTSTSAARVETEVKRQGNVITSRRVEVHGHLGKPHRFLRYEEPNIKRGGVFDAPKAYTYRAV